MNPRNSTICHNLDFQVLEMLNAGVQFEEMLSKRKLTDEERLLQYMITGDPSRVQILYEHAITEFSASADLWLVYTEYLDRTLKEARIAKDIYCRATWDCPCVGELQV